MIQRGVEIYELIQVTWSMADEDTRSREINGLLEASQATGCTKLTLITSDEEEEIGLDDGRKIVVVPAWKWMTMG